MRILIAHNFYQQPGGEDTVYYAEKKLLEDCGHEVIPFTVHNDEVNGMGRLTLARKTLGNRELCQRLGQIVATRRVQVAHFHNTLPLISPAAYHAARSAGAAVVQTLHNYRILCPNGLLFRDGQVCERCIGKLLPWQGIAHGCYRESRVTTAMVALTVAGHRMVGTYHRDVDLYITPSQFTRRLTLKAGLPEQRVVVKPHFVYPDGGVGTGDGGYAMFVGRLSSEKGLDTLLQAWRMLPNAPALKIVGDGPLADRMNGLPANVEWLRRQPPEKVHELLGRAAMLIFPSECYETFGRVVAEAFAAGTPVIASNVGSAAEMIDHGRTGLLFTGGNTNDLAKQVALMLADRAQLATMRQAVRKQFDDRYSAASNYQQLLTIYRSAMQSRGLHDDALFHHDELGRRRPAGTEAGGAAEQIQPAGHVLHSPPDGTPHAD